MGILPYMGAFGDLSNVTETIETIDVDTQAAWALLRDANNQNRPRRPYAVEAFKQILRNGLWHPFNPGGRQIIIARFPDGTRRLLDAQHRLHGIVEAGVTVHGMRLYTLDGITEDQAHALFLSLDTGSTRTDLDRIRSIRNMDVVRGIKNYTLSEISAGVRSVIMLDKLIKDGAHEYHKALKDNYLKDEQLRHTDRAREVLFVARLRHLTRPEHRVMPFGMLACAVEAFRINPKIAAEFFYTVISRPEGEMAPMEAEYCLRHQYADKATFPQNTEVQIRLYQITKTAWRRYCRDEDVQLLRPDTTLPLYTPTAKDDRRFDTKAPKARAFVASFWSDLIPDQEIADSVTGHTYMHTQNGNTEIGHVGD